MSRNQLGNIEEKHGKERAIELKIAGTIFQICHGWAGGMKEMDEKEYCISAGMFARMCQTTRDTLRYYEKQGILVPKKSEINGYHYYSYAQISSFYFISTFRGLGCSVEDIKEYLLGGEELRFDRFVDRQYEALLAQQKELERRIGIIGNTRKLLDQIRKNDTGKPELYEQPEYLRMKVTPVLSEPCTSFSEIASDIRIHLRGCVHPGIQAFPMGASIGREDFQRKQYAYKKVFSFASREVVREDIVELPSRCTVVMVCREKDGDIREAYGKIQEYLEEKGLELCSDIYSLSIVNVIDPNAERKYLKYIMGCVQSSH